MLRGVHQAICMLLVAALMFGGAVMFADSVSHAATHGLGSAHGHLNAGKHETADASNLSEPDTGNENQESAAGHCLGVHCCAPDSQLTAQYVPKHPPTGGTLVPRATSDYVFTCTYSLLRPPRATA